MKKIIYLIVVTLLLSTLWSPAVNAQQTEPTWFNYYDVAVHPDHNIGVYNTTGYKQVSYKRGNIEEDFLALVLKNPVLDANRDYLIFSLYSNNPDDFRAEIEIYESDPEASFSFSQEFEDNFIPIWLHFSGNNLNFKHFLESNYLTITYTIYDKEGNVTNHFKGTNIIFENFKYNEYDKQVKTVDAFAKQSTIIVDDVEHKVDTYIINDNTYFKLRDVAALLNGTGKQFNIELDKQLSHIIIEENKPYKPVGGELAPLKSKDKKKVTSKHTLLHIDFIANKTWAYNIDGNNYFKLRDIGDLVHFETSWNTQLGAIEIKTK